jgi:hypothetical protein
MTNDERTTGMGLWTDAKDMLAAAKLVSADEHLVTPAYYLAGHGIEEVFKAYLRSHGHSLGKLKKLAIILFARETRQFVAVLKTAIR